MGDEKGPTQHTVRWSATTKIFAAATETGTYVTHQKKWDAMYQELVAYQKVHGTGHVPSKWKENQTLANWVRMQRLQYKKQELSNVRIEKLNAIGFVWFVWPDWRERIEIYQRICTVQYTSHSSRTKLSSWRRRPKQWSFAAVY